MTTETLLQMKQRENARRKKRRQQHPAIVRERKIEALRRERKKNPNDSGLLDRLMKLLAEKMKL